MRTLLHLAARVYPSDWRERYGSEFDALLDDVTPGWAAVWDVLQGGVQMQVKRSRMAVSIGVFGIVGALAAGALGAATPDRFASSARLRFDHAPTVSQPGRLEYDRPAIFHTALSRASLAQIVERHGLYRAERASARLTLDEAAERMRNDISFLARRETSVFEVRYWHRDPTTAQRVAQDLMAQLVRPQDAMGVKVQVIDPPEWPRVPAGPNRPMMAGIGFGGGAFLGAVVALLFRRRPRPAN